MNESSHRGGGGGDGFGCGGLDSRMSWLGGVAQRGKLIQALFPLRVPVLGRVPSDMWQAVKDEWLQDLNSHRGRRQRTWWLCHLAVCTSHGRSRPTLEALSGWWHSHMSAECRPHLCGDPASRACS